MEGKGKAKGEKGKAERKGKSGAHRDLTIPGTPPHRDDLTVPRTPPHRDDLTVPGTPPRGNLYRYMPYDG